VYLAANNKKDFKRNLKAKIIKSKHLEEKGRK
jgi:hypothetical protein